MVLILNSSRSNAHLVLFTVEFFFNYPVKDLYEKSFRRYRCPLHLARTKQAHPLVPSLICVVEGKGTPLSRDYSVVTSFCALEHHPIAFNSLSFPQRNREVDEFCCSLSKIES
jgi:hypothetical protein